MRSFLGDRRRSGQLVAQQLLRSRSGWAIQGSTAVRPTRVRSQDLRQSRTTEPSALRNTAPAAAAAPSPWPAAAARREAADTTLRRIAIDLATDAAQAAGADRYAAMRAAHLTQAVLTQDRLTDHVLTALRGGTLDRTQTIAA